MSKRARRLFCFPAVHALVLNPAQVFRRRLFRLLIASGAMAAAGCASLPGAPGMTPGSGERFSESRLIVAHLDRDLAHELLSEDLGPDGGYVAFQAIAYQQRAAEAGGYDATDHAAFDWAGARGFYRKSVAAEAGEEIRPWNPADFGLGGDLETGYARTLEAAAQYKDIRPRYCARMVAFYDHWLHAARAGDDEYPVIGAMQGQWAEARRECVGGVAPVPNHGEVSWVVYFGFNRAHLDAAARDVLNDVMAAVQGGTPNGGPIRIDRVGSTAYGQGFSVRRARAVARALVTGPAPLREAVSNDEIEDDGGEGGVLYDRAAQGGDQSGHQGGHQGGGAGGGPYAPTPDHRAHEPSSTMTPPQEERLQEAPIVRRTGPAPGILERHGANQSDPDGARRGRINLDAPGPNPEAAPEESDADESETEGSDPQKLRMGTVN